MPQFDTYWFASQIFWLAIIFSAFYWFISRKALPRIGAVLDERARRIDGDLQKAEQAKRDAEEALAAYEARIAEARSESQAMLRAAAERMAADQAKALTELGKELSAQGKAAESRITAARDAALADIRSIATDASAALSQRLIGDTVDPAMVAEAVDRQLAEA